MCEFCLKHGDGEKWYLEARNYSEDLLSDLSRQRFVKRFLTDLDHLRTQAERLEILDKVPWLVRRIVSFELTRRQKKDHFGQVVPLEDIEKIFDLTSSIVRIPCICRAITTGKEQRYCYGVSLGPNGGNMRALIDELAPDYIYGPDAQGLEVIDKETAVALFREHEADGLCHSIWTFGTPFIAGICNCDRADCLAMKATVGHDVKIMFRAEYLARIDEEACAGCRACLEQCQFGAMGFSAGRQTAHIDPRACYGCGICRAACPSDAIELADRRSEPVAAGLW